MFSLLRPMISLAALTTLAALPTKSHAQSAAPPTPDSAVTRFDFPNPNATRLIFAPTARMLKAGEGYFSDFYIFLPGVNVGLTDRVSIGAMMSVLPGVDLDKQAFFLTPKVGIAQGPTVNVAAGALYVTVPGGGDSGDGGSAGILYGVGTWGGEDASITAGTGLGFVDGKFGRSPFIMLGGERRMTHRMSLVTENWLLPGGEIGLLSGGFRFMGAGMAVDFGFMRPTASDGDGVLVPMVGFVFKW